MDSLFEGMVLFTPNNNTNKSELDLETHNRHDLVNNQSQQLPLQQQHDYARDPAAVESHQPPSSSSSEPLDENLFSDLTLQFQTPTQTQEEDVVQIPTSKPTPTPKTTSRHNSTSRRKKRAAGLRIGYARSNSNSKVDDDVDDVYVDDDNSLPLPPTTTAISSTPVGPTTLPSVSVEEQVVVVNDQVEAPPELRLDQSKALIADKLNRTRKSAASVSVSRKDAIARRRAAADHLNLASFEYANLEKQLEEACEAEDFDTAQRLSDSLAAAQNQKQALLDALRDAEANCDALDSKMHHLLQSQIAAEEECASLLQRFATVSTPTSTF